MLRLWRKGMKITENIKSPAVVLLLTMLAFLTYSCDNGNEPSGARVYEGERVPLSINMGHVMQLTMTKPLFQYAQSFSTTRMNWCITMLLRS